MKISIKLSAKEKKISILFTLIILLILNKLNNKQNNILLTFVKTGPQKKAPDLPSRTKLLLTEYITH